ncbi:MAG: acetyltransferase [Pseudomonadota bacterium]
MKSIKQTNAVSIRRSRPDDAERVIEIWRAAVDATHDFLKPEDRIALDELICGFLPAAPLELAVDAHDRPLAFMLVEDDHMEALFVDPQCRGTGLGSLLVQHALAASTMLTTDVNEQNPQAIGFYKRLGFKEAGRSALDGQGRPYPLIHLASSS